MGEILSVRDEDRARTYIERGDELRKDFDQRFFKRLNLFTQLKQQLQRYQGLYSFVF